MFHFRFVISNKVKQSFWVYLFIYFCCFSFS